MRQISLLLLLISVLSLPLQAQDADSLLAGLIPLNTQKPVRLLYPDEWLQTDVMLYPNQEVKGLMANYDLLNHRLLVRHGSSTKVLQAHQVQQFSWIPPGKSPESYVNTAGFSSEVWLPGYFKSWGKGRACLLEYIHLPGNDFDSRDLMSGESVHYSNPDVQLESRWFIAKGQALRELSLRKAQVLEALDTVWQEEAKRLLKEHRLNLSQPEHVALLLQHYNAWLAGQ